MGNVDEEFLNIMDRSGTGFAIDTLNPNRVTLKYNIVTQIIFIHDFFIYHLREFKFKVPAPGSVCVNDYIGGEENHVKSGGTLESGNIQWLRNRYTKAEMRSASESLHRGGRYQNYCHSPCLEHM